jgi:hypothetical protein
MPGRPTLAVTIGLLGALVLTGVASAATTAEQTLAERYAPVVRLVQQKEECGPGEPYKPIDIDAILDEPTVALRGPWSASNLVEIGPSAADLGKGLYEYHLDFPGNPLRPGCSYERWARHVTRGTKPTVYAHTAAEKGKLALQYWLFYPFNDFNNTHEGDWEMIQLNFDAPDAERALETSPTDVGYSQHEGAERSAWDDEKLDTVGGTHPVVYAAKGSHANFYDSALFLGRSAAEGVGCDDTRGPHDQITPVVDTIPSDAPAAHKAYPWIAFEGRWGELQPAFFNGPTGPNLKEQWTKPITWSEGWRDRSYGIPAGGVLGTAATGSFCGAVGAGSNLISRLANNAALTLGVLAALVILVGWLCSRTSWRPGTPLRLARRRSWGQTVTATFRMYVRRPVLFIAIGLVTIPISILVTLLQTLILDASSVLGLGGSGEGGGIRAWVALAIGTILSLLGLTFVQAAAARAMAEIDAGREVDVIDVYRLVLDTIKPLFLALLVAVPIVSLFSISVFLIPVAIVFAVRWALIAPCVELESVSGLRALRRSGRLVRREWFKVLSLVVLTAGLVLVSGPVLGGLLLLTTSASFSVVNVVSGLIYAIAMPLVGITTTYVYYDVLAREYLAQREPPLEELPAEVSPA